MEEEDTNPLPLTVSMKAAPPAVAVVGLSEVICGVRSPPLPPRLVPPSLLPPPQPTRRISPARLHRATNNRPLCQFLCALQAWNRRSLRCRKHNKISKFTFRNGICQDGPPF